MNGDGATQDTPVGVDAYRRVRREAEEFVQGFVDAGILSPEDFSEAVDECLKGIGFPSPN